MTGDPWRVPLTAWRGWVFDSVDATIDAPVSAGGHFGLAASAGGSSTRGRVIVAFAPDTRGAPLPE